MPSIEMNKVLLRDARMADAKPLVGFDYDGGMYHLLLFDFGDDGGAVGVWREGDDFCAVWHMFDLLKDGWAGWEPQYSY